MFLDYLLNNIKLKTSDGVQIELSFILDRLLKEGNIKEYKLEIQETTDYIIHNIKVVLIEEEALYDVFNGLTNFIGFSYMNYYSREKYDDHTKYTYIN